MRHKNQLYYCQFGYPIKIPEAEAGQDTAGDHRPAAANSEVLLTSNNNNRRHLQWRETDKKYLSSIQDLCVP